MYGPKARQKADGTDRNVAKVGRASKWKNHKKVGKRATETTETTKERRLLSTIFPSENFKNKNIGRRSVGIGGEPGRERCNGISVSTSIIPETKRAEEA